MDVSANYLHLFTLTLSYSINGQFFSLWNASIIAVFNTISYARNQSFLFCNDIPMCRALVILSMAIRKENMLTYCYMHNIVSDLLLVKKLRVSLKSAKALQILKVWWCLPPVNCVKENTDAAALGLTGPTCSGGIPQWVW